jgi:hypothetical protein
MGIAPLSEPPHFFKVKFFFPQYVWKIDQHSPRVNRVIYQAVIEPLGPVHYYSIAFHLNPSQIKYSINSIAPQPIATVTAKPLQKASAFHVSFIASLLCPSVYSTVVETSLSFLAHHVLKGTPHY